MKWTSILFAIAAAATAITNTVTISAIIPSHTPGTPSPFGLPRSFPPFVCPPSSTLPRPISAKTRCVKNCAADFAESAKRPLRCVAIADPSGCGSCCQQQLALITVLDRCLSSCTLTADPCRQRNCASWDGNTRLLT
jgi:hypothetical protein